jgi:hypothetical protein
MSPKVSEKRKDLIGATREDILEEVTLKRSPKGTDLRECPWLLDRWLFQRKK